MRILPVFILILIILATSHTHSLQAQRSQRDSLFMKNRLKAEFRLDIGNAKPTNDFVRLQFPDLDGIPHYYSYSLRLAKQTTGNKLWEQLYGYPEYGLGVYSAVFTNTKNLGNPIAVYGFFNAPIFRIKALSLNYELGLGFAFNWNHYDPVTNPGNIAISQDGSVYMDAGINLKYPLTKRINLSVGYGFTHFSNGRLKLPNKGLNTGESKINLSYDLYDDPISYISKPKPRYVKHYEWIVSAYGGVQNVVYLGTDVNVVTGMKGIYMPVYGFSNTFNRQIDYKSKIGFGFTVGYNGSQNSQIIVESGKLDEKDISFYRHLSLSIYPSYELVINRLSVVIQPGIYLFRKSAINMSPALYQRIGVKYHFLKNTFTGISLRANKFYISDFIEWTVGQRINW